MGDLPLFRNEPETNLFSGWTVDAPADADPGTTPLFGGGLLLRNEILYDFRVLGLPRLLRIFVIPTNLLRQALEERLTNVGNGELVKVWLVFTPGSVSDDGTTSDPRGARMYIRYTSRIRQVLIAEWTADYNAGEPE